MPSSSRRFPRPRSGVILVIERQRQRAVCQTNRPCWTIKQTPQMDQGARQIVQLWQTRADAENPPSRFAIVRPTRRRLQKGEGVRKQPAKKSPLGMLQRSKTSAGLRWHNRNSTRESTTSPRGCQSERESNAESGLGTVGFAV